MPGAEPPRSFLPEQARRLARRVEHDDTSRDGQIASGMGEPCGVEPEGVIVLCPESDRDVAAERVEQLPCRDSGGIPVGVPPPVADDPATGSGSCDRRAHPIDRLRKRSAPLEPDLALGEGPGREVDVGVVEAGKDTTAPEIDTLRAGKRKFVRTDATHDPVAGDCKGTGRRQERVHRPHRPVLEDHRSNILAGLTGLSGGWGGSVGEPPLLATAAISDARWPSWPEARASRPPVDTCSPARGSTSSRRRRSCRRRASRRTGRDRPRRCSPRRRERSS